LKNRLKKIHQVLSEYSLGEFDKRLEISPQLDQIDSFMAGINMLGEELKSTTISRNYFNNIFHSVSDMLFVLNEKGQITDMNNSVCSQLGYNLDDLKGQCIDTIIPVEGNPFFSNLLKELSRKKGYVSKKTNIKTAEGKSIPVTISAGNLFNEKKKKVGCLLTVKDITLQIETENLIIRTIIDTQEKERLRLAKDLHDSLGQQLSAIKFYISTSSELSSDNEQKRILIKSEHALTSVLADMRNICFNLMPETLEEFGLIEAVKGLCNQIQHDSKIDFRITVINVFPKIEKEVEIDIYRIIQEFINNAMKHGKATVITIDFNYTASHAKIILSDNGKGFKVDKSVSKGMGLQNMESRAKSHNGVLNIKSETGKGTKLTIAIPIK
jgi:PAS domain S-box-containing protein